jgi:transposase
LLRTIEQTPNAENATVAELEVAMEAAPNKRSYIRLGAMRLLLKGTEREQVCMIYNRTDRMVRLWVEMFNRGGIDALATKRPGGRQRKVKIEQLNDLLVPVLETPSLAGQQHWTGVKVHGWLREQLAMELGYRTVIRYLHQLDYNLRVPRPWPEKQDEQARAAFIEQMRLWQQEENLELWFADECGIEGDPRPRRRWSQRGSRPTVPYFGRHIRSNVVGAVCPASGESFCMIFNGVDTDVFQCYLDYLAEAVPKDPNKRRILILDNASWHKAQRLNWHHFELQFLPAYSPDFNPIERLWLRLKADYFADFIAKNTDELNAHLCSALNALMNDKSTVSSQCAFRK